MPVFKPTSGSSGSHILPQGSGLLAGEANTAQEPLSLDCAIVDGSSNSTEGRLDAWTDSSAFIDLMCSSRPSAWERAEGHRDSSEGRLMIWEFCGDSSPHADLSVLFAKYGVVDRMGRPERIRRLWYAKRELVGQRDRAFDRR
ncbi:hypothetical protein LTR49_028038 [Elasticomyces elasticus]|nr:hypothetical protein LTR49_028038 [Elasticomyces elasticus]